ncbi:UDP-glucose 4-epimerase [Candidatus Heimdallarchaeota archaeon B3_Heim]|nr:MAG: UDP-glucose 4-epimerase [Candidatus Heimdallarchaeota archaeon B3_Heim]
MKVLVTGGAGFVGSHLIEELLVQGHEVVCLDNFTSGKRINLEPFKEKITLIEGDILNLKDVQAALEDVESVYHLAAQISVTQSVRNPLHDASININGFINILNTILESSVKRVVYVSTGGAIYGEPLHIPASETTPEEPISPYGLSKLVGEKYLKWFNATHGLSYAIIRPANIYGPRQDPLGEAGVISIYLGRMLNKKPLEIFGDGSDTRDYVYVKDIAAICTTAMASNVDDTYNAGTGIQTSLNELVEIIGEVTTLPIKKVFKPPRPGDVKKIALDITKAKKILKWTPQTTFNTGIQNTWDWFKNTH